MARFGRLSGCYQSFQPSFTNKIATLSSFDIHPVIGEQGKRTLVFQVCPQEILVVDAARSSGSL
jgi:hypothetical protein